MRSARTGHHAQLRKTFVRALNDRDVAGLTRIMGKLAASIDH